MTQQIDELLYKIYDVHEDQETEIILRSQFEHLEAQIKAKDKEIERLEKVASDLFIEGLLSEREQDAKASSIVAMLFWKWRRMQRLIGKNHFATKGNEDAFKKAYEMLKDKR